ncbi:MAG: outer membrane lipoprotein-sorting protein [Flavobacteriaceae bacterium]|nr:outer membrane lipoprotein-sorting protein [Flavobacteriaceae bacterium]
MNKQFFISTVFFIFLTAGYAQTAEQIINKHLEITGGVTKWKGFNSTVISGEMILGLNESYPVVIYQQRPNWSKTVMQIQSKNMILTGYNGKKAVQFNFRTNKLEENADYIPETFDSDLIDYSGKGFQAVFIGTEKIENSDCYKIKLIKNTNTNTYYFDTKSYQLIREVNSLETKTYSDFRKSSGLTFPYRIEVKSSDGESDFALVFKTIEVNKVISAKEFVF